MESVKFLVRQGLPIRGHTDDESNLLQLLKCRTTDVEGLAWISSGKYLSDKVTNEIVELMAHHLLHNLLGAIRIAKYFSIIVDEIKMFLVWNSLQFR